MLLRTEGMSVGGDLAIPLDQSGFFRCLFGYHGLRRKLIF